jgi:hypothetical protein
LRVEKLALKRVALPLRLAQRCPAAADVDATKRIPRARAQPMPGRDNTRRHK